MVHHRPRTGQSSLLGVSNDIASVVHTFQPHIIVGDFNTQLDVSNWLELESALGLGKT